MTKILRLILYDRRGIRCLPNPGWVRVNTDVQPQRLAFKILENKDAVLAELQDEKGQELDVQIADVDQLTWRFYGVPYSPASAACKALATATIRVGSRLDKPMPAT